MDSWIGASLKVLVDPGDNQASLESVHFPKLFEGRVAVLDVIRHLEAQLREYLLVGVAHAVVCSDRLAQSREVLLVLDLLEDGVSNEVGDRFSFKFGVLAHDFGVRFVKAHGHGGHGGLLGLNTTYSIALWGQCVMVGSYVWEDVRMIVGPLLDYRQWRYNCGGNRR